MSETRRRRSVPALAVVALLATLVVSAPPARASSADPFVSGGWYVDPASNAQREADARRDTDPDRAALFDRIASRPQADWFGDWIAPASLTDTVAARTTTIRDAGAVPVYVTYAIPARDCGGYSAGGTASPAAYRAWVDAFAAGLDGEPVAVVVEPDALGLLDCLTTTQRSDRLALLGYAVDTLGAAGASVYLDAGHSAWHAASTMADRLRAAGVDRARGFSLNVSNHRWTGTEVAYAVDLAGRLGGAHAVIDTSRNGQGPTPDGQWCNAPGRGLGSSATTATANPVVDAELWIKRPGESDGTCNGGPAAGQWWPEGAAELAAHAIAEPRDPVAPSPPPPSPLPPRTAGTDRVATALAVAEVGWTTTEHVVLARSDDPADALAGTALAGHLDAPLLVTDPTGLDPRVGRAIRDLEAREVVLLGGQSALSDDVAAAVRAAGARPRRVAGATRSGTAVAIAEQLASHAPTALLVHERSWADALAVSGLAARQAAAGDPWPVLLVGDDVPTETRGALDRLGVTRTLVVGGPAAVPAAIDATLREAGIAVSRLAGGTRHATSSAAAARDIALHGGGPLLLATSAGFADGLSAGALAARVGGVLLLAPPDAADPGQLVWVRTVRDDLTAVAAIGGPAALDDATSQAMEAARTRG